MKRSSKLVVAAVAVITAACADRVTSASQLDALDAAFVTNPVGFEYAASSFSADNSPEGGQFMPGDRAGQRGPNGLGGGHDFMGGGFIADFLGGPLGGGRPFDRGGVGSDDSCVFAAATGVVTCAAQTHDGVTVNRTLTYKTAAGAAQAKQDSTTNSVVSHVTVAGTRTRRDSTTSTVASTSDRTVTGLAYNATQRTVNGTSRGTETGTGRDTAGTFTVSRVIGDTTSGIIIPIVSGKPTYPTAGKVVRAMSATVTHSGKAAVSSTRREVVTYDGSATATLVVTQDGTTKNCTVALPRGRPSCS